MTFVSVKYQEADCPEIGTKAVLSALDVGSSQHVVWCSEI